MLATRRGFCAGVCAALAGVSAGQFSVGGTSQTTRLDLAAVDSTRILAGAVTALRRSPVPSEDATSESFLQMTLDVPALAAAAQVDPGGEARYAAKAAETLRQWFGVSGAKTGLRIAIEGHEDLLGLSALAEVALSVPFLPLDDEVSAGAKAWFKQYLGFLTTNVEAGLARDAKDRVGSSWLLQVAAFARLCGDDAATEEARKRFRHATLRAELNADGFFPNELRTANPLRNSLMNLDMLAGVCMLLSTRFESMWEVELQDGPGMRTAVARHAAYMKRREAWPYPADATHFKELPGRRPVLPFAARAYAQPEYASLYLQLPDTTDPELLPSLPIRQPLLWVTQPRRRG